MKSEKIDTITIKIPHKTTKQFDKIAKEEDRTRSSVMRMAFEKFLEDYNEERWARKVVEKYKKDKSKPISFEKMLKSLNISRKELDEMEVDFSDCD